MTALPVKHVRRRRRCCAPISTTKTTTIRTYRERVAQCEALGEFAMAEDIREILRQEQEHQIDLATALGEDVPTRRSPEPRWLGGCVDTRAHINGAGDERRCGWGWGYVRQNVAA